MTNIKLLPEKVINQIAAGEVVERPASVVRELVDNALDAGATAITVSLVDGGHTSILISDNGHGMSSEDALLAFERHATSKIKDIVDLYTIATKGFRGEALASIASVARVRLRTKREEDASATEVHISGGKITSVQPVPGALGTEIDVRNLFFNTPARRKFLKSQRSEETKVKEWILHTSLAYPTVRFRLYLDDREVLNLPTVSHTTERASRVFRGSMVTFQEQYDEISLTGMIGHPSLAQGDINSFVILVNKRLITDRAILRAVKEGFSSTLKEREFPIGFISIDIPGDFVDINVNPQKSEVRFSAPQKIFVAVRGSIADALQEFKAPVSSDWIQPRSEATTSWSPQRVEATPMRMELLSQYPSSENVSTHSLDVNDAQEATICFRYSELRYIGQLLKCYLLCEREGIFYIVDMHAAHERLNFNIIREQMKNRAVLAQKLLVPQTVQLTARLCEQLESSRELLESYGFEFDQFGDDAVLIRAVPSVLQHGDPAAVLKEFAAFDSGYESKPITERLDYVAARIACHGSIRSGRVLKSEEAYALFEQMDSASFSAACPHGRPCIISFDEKQVEQWFGRDR